MPLGCAIQETIGEEEGAGEIYKLRSQQRRRYNNLPALKFCLRHCDMIKTYMKIETKICRITLPLIPLKTTKVSSRYGYSIAALPASLWAQLHWTFDCLLWPLASPDLNVVNGMMLQLAPHIFMRICRCESISHNTNKMHVCDGNGRFERCEACLPRGGNAGTGWAYDYDWSYCY